MNWTEQRRRFRAVLAGDKCLHPASVYDPISARIAEDLGFELGMFAGSIASLAVLGAPDIIVLTLSEFADLAYRICRAGKLPVLVDADHGYGNALNVRRTIEELENAGVAAATIEDTVLPRAFGTGKQQLISIEEGVGKMKAALSARQDPSFTIIARTSATAVTGIPDAVARARAYEAAGVDALFLAQLQTRAEIEAIHAAVKLPIVVGPVAAELRDRDYLASQGVRVALQGHTPFMAAIQATYDTMKALRDGAAPADLKGLPSASLMRQVTRDDDYKKAATDFLS